MYAHSDGVKKDIKRNSSERRTKNKCVVPGSHGVEASEKGQTGMCAPDGVAPPEVYQTDPLFEDWRGKMNYLDDPNVFSVSGLDKFLSNGKSATVNDRVDINESNLFVCAYPSGSIAELTQTRLLYENVRETNIELKVAKQDGRSKTKKSVVTSTPNSIELDPTITLVLEQNEMEPLRDFARSIEGIYFIHNFKGSNRRCYFGVIRRLEGVSSSSERCPRVRLVQFNETLKV